MYAAIVLLPLAGAIIAGLISLLGAHKVIEAEAEAAIAPPRRRGAVTGHGADDHGRPSVHAQDAHDHGHDAHGAAHAGHGDELGEPELESPGVKPAQLVTTGSVVIAALLSWIVLFTDAFGTAGPTQVTLLSWIHAGGLAADWALRIDTLTCVMLVVVTTVSALVHVYSIGYMAHDPHRPRFFAYLSFFTFAMLALVTADNLVQLFFGWEGVGLASYLLIGFWYKRPTANAAAIKAFIVNRVGDFGFALGIFGIFFVFGAVDFGTIFAAAEEKAGEGIEFLGMELDAITVLCFLLFIGAMGKSAQLFLHTWLPDAMEGPTPVSALIHAATMVTAGVFLVARMSPLFEHAPEALAFVTVIGASTAFFAGTVGLVQNDIKRVIAYSTCSQLGFMFVALGCGAYSVAIFHLFTHAFFKALLFLGSGSVIHAMGDEQDMRRMGGLRRVIPLTYIMMVIGTLALTGFPLLAGFYSKDAIIEVAYAATGTPAGYAFLLLATTTALTALYSWRLILLTFHGQSRAPAEVMAHAHESPPVMLVPLFILAAGAIFAGMLGLNWFFGDGHDAFWRGALYYGHESHILEAAHHVPVWVTVTPSIAMAVGLALAMWLYRFRPGTATRIAEEQDVLYRFLLNAWYFDVIYDRLIVRPVRWLGRFLWKKGDGWLIDGFGPDGVSARVMDVTRGVVRIQSGYIYHYAFAMLIGAALLVSWLLFRS